MSRDLAPDSVERAIALVDLGRLEDAEAELRDALREEPDDPLAHGILALVLLDLDRADEALQVASATIALAPDFPVGYAARARALLSFRRFEEAETSAYEAIRLDPEDPDHWVLVTLAALGQQQWADGISAADKALSLDPESETARGLYAVALAMSERGADWQDAAADTLAAAPDSPVAHSLSGYAHLLGGGEREAATRFREALRLDPESELAQGGLADAMKASHPLFKPFFRFFLWQEHLSRNWRIALVVGPLLVLKALRPAYHNPFVIALIALWFLFVAVTWMSIPIANLALRLSPVGRAVLPAEEKGSSAAFLACVIAALVAVVLTFAVNGGFALTAFTAGLLAFALGSAHKLRPRRRRIVYAWATAAVVVAFVGGALIPVRVGSSSLGAIIVVVAMFSAVALLWTVRFS